MTYDLVSKENTVLVTGGAGFIGSHIVDRLLSYGNEVVIVDNLSTGKKENINPKAIFYSIDIADEKALKCIFEQHKIASVIHQAAKINLNVLLEDPSNDIKSSVLGTLNLLNLCVSSKIEKFVYASSVAVYGRPRKLPVSETDELIPIYSYGIAKKCAEEYVRYYSEYYGMNYTILRYANVYGPRQPIYGEVGVIAIYTDRAIKGEPLIIYGDGAHLRDYIYIDDVVDVTLKMLKGSDREIFNVGCGVGISVKEVFENFGSSSGKMLNHKYEPERVGELGFFYCDISKLTKTMQWSPTVTIKEGICRTLSYYRDSIGNH